MHIHIYYSIIKKNEMMSFAATWIDLENIILSEISQTEKDKYYMLSVKKKNTNEFIYRIETDCRPGEQIYSYQGEVGEGYIRSTGLTKNKLHVTPQSYKS